jgi:hypothetical protein
MAEQKQKPYEPYSPSNQEADLAENRGTNATEPAPLNGWRDEFERNTFDRRGGK